MDFHLNKPCNECPFRRNSVPGWLGPWQPEELLLVLGRAAFPCHKTVKHGHDHDEDQPGLQSCAGMAIFLNNKVERSRNSDNAHHQDLLRGSSHAGKVFRNSSEFLNHHKE